jgi:signal peptide peptidase SppA
MITSNTDNFTGVERFGRISTLLYNEPWLLSDVKFEAMCVAFENAVANLEAIQVQAKPKPIPQPVMMGNSAVIGVDGVLAKKMNLFSNISGGASIQMLDKQFMQALDSEAGSVILHIDSPGGAVDGVPEFATKVHQAAQSSDKVIVAFADGLAASGAYWIGSQANEFHITEATTVGSIGVMARLFDDTRRMKNSGVEPITVRSAEAKAPTVPPFTAKGLESIQKSVAVVYDMFKDAVVRGRPGISIEDVATGETFIGQEAVDKGLVDSITTLDKLIDKLS